jgi:hypothetical protein
LPHMRHCDRCSSPFLDPVLPCFHSMVLRPHTVRSIKDGTCIPDSFIAITPAILSPNILCVCTCFVLIWSVVNRRVIMGQSKASI